MTTPFVSTSSLRGAWERSRVLLDNLGGPWPEQVTPVYIIGDSREPGGLPLSYRRFGGSRLAASVPVNTQFKWKAQCGMVIDCVTLSATAMTSDPPTLRLLSLADVAADVAATYSAPAAGSAGYMDGPDAAPPAFLIASNGSTGIGRVVWQWPFSSTATGLTVFPGGIYLPAGTAWSVNCLATVTNMIVAFTGYLFPDAHSPTG